MMPVEEMMTIAAAAVPNEACGLLVARGQKVRVLQARNLAANPRRDFELDPDAWLEVEQDERVVAIFHSHPVTSAQPSMQDKVSCEASNLSWHIVNPQTFEHVVIHPCGFKAPYIDRVFAHGLLDCYTLVRDWYERELGVTLSDFYRADSWWDKGENLYVDNYAQCGFQRLIDQPHQRGDLALIQYSSSVPNHAGVLLGDGTMLHHVQGRLSCTSPWGGVWERHCTHHLRHESQMGAIHG